MTVFEIDARHNVVNWIQLLMMYAVDQSKQCAQIYLQKNACCLKLQLLILFFCQINYFRHTLILTLTLTLTLKIVYLDTTDILQLNYYVQHIGNKKIYIGCAKETI